MKAGERVRTVDIQLGKLTLYQLSYTRRWQAPMVAPTHQTRMHEQAVRFTCSRTYNTSDTLQ